MRLCVITGIRRGLGAALAEGLRRRDVQVLGCSPNSPPPHQVDVTDFAALGRWADYVLGVYGPPDLLVCNAAVVNPLKRLWELEPDEFGRVIDVNLKGVFHTIKVFLPAMLEAGRGVIVNLSSGWGRTTSPRVASYCCTKFGIEGLTRSLAQELPRGLAAVALNPGTIDTDMLRTAFGAAARNYPSPDRWAEAAVPFILSLGPEHNGQSLDVPLS